MSDDLTLSTAPATEAPPRDPSRYRCPWKFFSATVLVLSLTLLGGGYVLAGWGGIPGVVVYILTCTLVGLVFTLCATAWGAVISLTESPTCGFLFILLPPYMFYYAATRWRWMSQPSILFLSGLGLMAWSIPAGRQMLAAMGNP